MTTTLVHTAGQTVAVHGSEVVVRSLVEASGGPDQAGGTIGEQADVVLEVEAVRRPFNIHGFEVVTRGVWANGSGEVVLADVGGSGFDQRWTIDVDGLHVTSRWRPPHQALAAARLLPARHRALSGQVLLHYPALWFAVQRGCVPLHVSMVEVGGVAVLLAGPGGVGKSTLVARALADGARASCDNVAVCSAAELSRIPACGNWRRPRRLAGSSPAPIPPVSCGDSGLLPPCWHRRRDAGRSIRRSSEWPPAWPTGFRAWSCSLATKPAQA
jgi:hypothetical protein